MMDIRSIGFHPMNMYNSQTKNFKVYNLKSNLSKDLTVKTFSHEQLKKRKR
jgi:hypothetical protein